MSNLLLAHEALESQNVQWHRMEISKTISLQKHALESKEMPAAEWLPACNGSMTGHVCVTAMLLVGWRDLANVQSMGDLCILNQAAEQLHEGLCQHMGWEAFSGWGNSLAWHISSIGRPAWPAALSL